MGFFTRKILKAIVVGAAAVGTALVGAGAVKTYQANKINKEAEDLRNKAMGNYEAAYGRVKSALQALGNNKLIAIKNMQLFADLISNIQERPEFNDKKYSKFDLPEYNPKEIKRISATVESLAVGTIGAGAGGLIGLAAFGATAIVAAPALLGGGIALFVKGNTLKQQAINNLEDARKLQERTIDLVNCYDELYRATTSFDSILCNFINLYTNYLSKSERIVIYNKNWKTYTQEEKTTIENAVLITRLLYEMCTIDLIVKNEEGLETVNQAEVATIQQKAQIAYFQLT